MTFKCVCHKRSVWMRWHGISSSYLAETKKKTLKLPIKLGSNITQFSFSKYLIVYHNINQTEINYCLCIAAICNIVSWLNWFNQFMTSAMGLLRPGSDAVPLMCRTKYNQVRLWHGGWFRHRTSFCRTKWKNTWDTSFCGTWALYYQFP